MFFDPILSISDLLPKVYYSHQIAEFLQIVFNLCGKSNLMPKHHFGSLEKFFLM